MVRIVPSSSTDARFSTVGVTVGVGGVVVEVLVGVAVAVGVWVGVLVTAGVAVGSGVAVARGVGTAVGVAVATNGSERASPGEALPIAIPQTNGISRRPRRLNDSSYLRAGAGQLYRSMACGPSSGVNCRPAVPRPSRLSCRAAPSARWASCRQ